MATFTLSRTDKNDDTVTYSVDNLIRFSINMQTPVAPMPISLLPSDQTLLIKVEGNTTTCNINWKIRNAGQVFTGEKPSGAPSLSSIQDPLEIIDYWNEYFVPVTPDENLVLTIGNGDMVLKGSVQSVSFNISKESPVVWEGNLVFVEGNVAAAVQTDKAESIVAQVLNSSHTGGNMNGENYVAHFNNLQTPFLGSSDGITGYEFKYRTGGSGSFTDVGSSDIEYGTSNTTATIQQVYIALPSAGTYEIKFAPKVSGGLTQQFSNLYTVAVS